MFDDEPFICCMSPAQQQEYLESIQRPELSAAIILAVFLLLSVIVTLA